VATQREILKRIRSVASTKKITKTMEMVSTAKMKKMQNKMAMSQPFSKKLDHIIANLRKSGVEDVFDILLQERPNPNKALILMITGNRGLCGGYNTNVIDKTLAFKEKLSIEEGKEVLLYNIGKKGFNFLRFVKEPVFKHIPNFEDKLTFDDALKLGNELINLFVDEVDEVYISYTKVITSATQKPEIIRLLPITPEKQDVEDASAEFHLQYIFEPNPYKIFQSLLPFYIKVKIYSCLIESGFSEQVARRVAMKNATDAATEMVRELTIRYNRVRQAKITNEIAEIVGGASAL
jgi:F-type H+-transporting ATPase subunit gamma